MNVSVLQKQYLYVLLFCFEAGSHFISQAGLYLALLPQPPECKHRDNRCAHWLASCFQSSLQAGFPLCVWKKEHPVPEPFCSVLKAFFKLIHKFLGLEIRFLSPWKVSGEFSLGGRVLSALEKCH